jgi:hypothetical protein
MKTKTTKQPNPLPPDQRPAEENTTMPIFYLHISMGNTTFDETPASELARILEHTARRIRRGDLPPLILHDSQGWMVGKANID